MLKTLHANACLMRTQRSIHQMYIKTSIHHLSIDLRSNTQTHSCTLCVLLGRKEKRWKKKEMKTRNRRSWRWEPNSGTLSAWFMVVLCNIWSTTLFPHHYITALFFKTRQSASITGYQMISCSQDIFCAITLLSLSLKMHTSAYISDAEEYLMWNGFSAHCFMRDQGLLVPLKYITCLLECKAVHISLAKDKIYSMKLFQLHYTL